MKIRNGFVSNSSSSSFILTYNKSKITHDPKELVDYLKEHPYNNVIMRGTSINEGDDIFELTSEMKKCIRIYSDDFIEINTGKVIDNIWDEEKQAFVDKEVDKITAYLGEARLVYDTSDYLHLDVEDGDDYYERLEVTRDEAFKKQLDEEIESLKEVSEDKDNIVGEKVWVDYQATDGKYDFKANYLTREDSYEYSCIARHYDEYNPQSYAIVYEDIIEDKKELIELLDSNKDTIYLSRFNRILNGEEGSCDLDLYELGEDEIKFLKENKESFVENNYSILAFVNCSLYKSGDTIKDAESKRVFIERGRVALIKSNNGCLNDFKDTFI